MSSLALPTVGGAGSIDRYIHSVGQFPFLTQEEEINYALRLRDHGDLEAARALVVSHLRVVVALARGFVGYGLPQSDLIQEGNIGLMKAVKRFDPNRGVRLVSFALHWIRAEMHEYILRNWRIVKIATTKAQRKLFFNLRSMKSGLNALGHDDVKLIAKQLGVKPEEVIEMEMRLGGQDLALEPGSQDDDDHHFGPITYLSAENAEPAMVIEQNQTEQLRGEGLDKALRELDDRSRKIIQARWLTEKNPATLHELASELGISAERVRQIENKAMEKMKTWMLA